MNRHYADSSINQHSAALDQDTAAAYTSLRVELAHIFGPVQPREGQTWNEAMLARITERLVDLGCR